MAPRVSQRTKRGWAIAPAGGGTRLSHRRLGGLRSTDGVRPKRPGISAANLSSAGKISAKSPSWVAVPI